MRTYAAFFISLFLILLSGGKMQAQQYKIRQVTTVMNMKSESTVYVKGMRKRTEAAGMMGMPTPPITLEQCDLQRTIWINDKKKLYYIEPFGKEDVMDDDAKNTTAVKTKNADQVKEKSAPKIGGVITMWYNITDTGERKKISGFTARHVWTTQKMKPSPDACMMKDSMIIKTDGWYIDLPQFNCPVRYTPATQMPGNKNQPDCRDKFVTRRSGKGKLGFPLSETRTIIMGGSTKTTEFTTSMETLEFSTARLDSMLFEIPAGYTLASDVSELQEKFDVKEMMSQGKDNYDHGNSQLVDPEHKSEGNIRIGVYEPNGGGQPDAVSLQKYLATVLTGDKIEAIPVGSEEEAKKYDCDYSLTTDFGKIKQAGKVGGLLKAIKNADPNAASSYNIEAGFTLKSLADGSIRTQPKVSGKYQGNMNEAAKRAIDDGSVQVLKGIK